MRFKVDENLPSEIASDLRTSGHEADSVWDEGLSGAPDPAVLARAKRESRVVLTLDKGVGDIRAYPPELYPGIVLFRPVKAGRSSVLEFVRRHLPALLDRKMEGHLFVVSERGIRIR